MEINADVLKVAKEETKRKLNPERKPAKCRVLTAYFFDDDEEMAEVFKALCRKYPSKRKNGTCNLTEYFRAHKDEILGE